jgi:serine/threonine protein kinase
MRPRSGIDEMLAPRRFKAHLPGTQMPKVPKSFTRQLAQGMNYLHLQALIIHRDLPATCSLITRELLKISDFGLKPDSSRPRKEGNWRRSS